MVWKQTEASEMKDPVTFTTRKFDLLPDQTAFKNAERSLYIKYDGLACGVVQCPREWLEEIYWFVKIWVYPPNINGFDCGRPMQRSFSLKFASSILAIRWLKKNTKKIITNHNIWLAHNHPWEKEKHGIIQQAQPAFQAKA
jgi:hypothetical protein